MLVFSIALTHYDDPVLHLHLLSTNCFSSNNRKFYNK